MDVDKNAFVNHDKQSSDLETVMIKGKYVEGAKESSFFTHIPWVKEQFKTKLSFDAYPGTFNVDVIDPEDVAKLKEIKGGKGIEIIPAEPEFCLAKCFRVLICGKIKGALVIPLIPNYPASKLEIISSDKITEALSLKIGDLVQVEIFKSNI